MLQYGDLIISKIKPVLEPDIHVQANFPEQLGQYSPAVFVVFNGYDILNKACKTTHIATYWATYIAVKNARAQGKKKYLDLAADNIFRTLYNEINGAMLDDEQAKPVYMNDRASIPELLPNMGFYPIGWTIETIINEP